MAGGVAKGIGSLFLILGALLLVGGALAAGIGFYMGNEQSNRGLFADSSAVETAELLLVGGAIAGGVGALLLILGGILLAVGGSLARRELLRAVAGAGASVPAGQPGGATPRKTGRIVGGSVLAILLLAGVVFAMAQGDGPGGGSLLGARGSGGTEDAPTVVANRTFEGHTQGAGIAAIGSLNTPVADAVHELPLTAGSYALVATLNWSADGPAGASSLELVLEVENAGVWEELASGEGGPGLVVEVAAQELASNVRARVFAASGAVDQRYTLDIVAFAP